jgi:phage shock protein PspC (stress-responsive transcriptional regulator)
MATKKLVRDTKNSKVTGLCAGFANYTDMDVSVVRIIMLAIILFSGVVPGLAFYLIAAAVVPAK